MEAKRFSPKPPELKPVCSQPPLPVVDFGRPRHAEPISAVPLVKTFREEAGRD
jgi:hypothetical protein